MLSGFFFWSSFDQDIKYLFPNFGYSSVVTGLLIYYHWEAMLVSYLATRFVVFPHVYNSIF